MDAKRHHGIGISHTNLVKQNTSQKNKEVGELGYKLSQMRTKLNFKKHNTIAKYSLDFQSYQHKCFCHMLFLAADFTKFFSPFFIVLYYF